MTKVGITGQSGFMGSHLYNYLGLTPDDFKRIEFKKEFFDSEKDLKTFVKSCDVIVHIAAMNRHEDEQVIYKTNLSLVQKLIVACEATKANPKIIFSSSTQEERDNIYGKSKRDGRKLLEDWAKKSGGSVISLVIPNVFGPFGKPFYNSVVATFCHQLANGETPVVENDSEVKLIYINELSEIFRQYILSENLEDAITVEVQHTSVKKVSELLKILKKFKSEYQENGVVPNLSLSFEKDLFNTYTSFLPKNYFPIKFTKHTDERGAFVEIMRAGTPGQTSYSTTVPGITRGNHYHTRKVERFAVLSGKAVIKMRKINTEVVLEYHIDGKEPAYVDMPIWFTHNITNVGNTELLTIFWINEPYDAKDPDTYFEKV